MSEPSQNTGCIFQNSAESAEGRRNWAYLPTPSGGSKRGGGGGRRTGSPTTSTSSDVSSSSVGEAVTWEQRVEQALGEGVAACAAAAREAEEELVANAVATLEGGGGSPSTKEKEEEKKKTRAISAKSHIFRKGKVDAAR